MPSPVTLEYAERARLQHQDGIEFFVETVGISAAAPSSALEIVHHTLEIAGTNDAYLAIAYNALHHRIYDVEQEAIDNQGFGSMLVEILARRYDRDQYTYERMWSKALPVIREPLREDEVVTPSTL